jgi:hypothetical protein
LNLVSTGEQVLHVRNFTNYQIANTEAWFRTNNSAETQEVVEYMSQKGKSTYYDWDTGEATVTKTEEIVSTQYEKGDIMLLLLFKIR